MSLIEWKDEYSVGVPAVDDEHRELIALINTLGRAVEDDRANRDEVIETLGEIFAQIAAHFALEERMMRESRYDAYEEHKADHEALLDQLRDMMDRVEDESFENEDWLPQELGPWFGVHFRTHDARLHRRQHS